MVVVYAVDLLRQDVAVAGKQARCVNTNEAIVNGKLVHFVGKIVFPADSPDDVVHELL
ncbi:MAG: hypothetical protein U0703_03765 [Anaerolineae bacterium]